MPVRRDNLDLLTLFHGREKVLVGLFSRGKGGIKSFTLIELLIVIAILAVLAAAVVIVLNPAELLAQARDGQRVTEINSLKKSLDLFILDNPSASLGVAQRVYVSLPSTTAPNCDAVGLPSLPSGWQYVCASSTNLRNANGTGWIPLDFTTVKGGSPLPYLPIDPTNDASSGKYYTYVMGGSYELTAVMEANKENPSSIADGGSLPGVYEAGTHIGLTPPTRDKGLVGYWTFDEGSGSTAYDSSGRGNDGTLYNLPTWQASINCKKGTCLSFDGINDYASAPLSNNGMTDSFTASAWFKFDEYAYRQLINASTFNFKWRIVGQNPYWNLYNSSGGYVGAIHYNTAPTLNEWHHYAFTYDGSYRKIYLDGDLNTQSAVSSSILIPSSFAITSSSGEIMKGLADDIRVYNRALFADEIKAIYDATK